MPVKMLDSFLAGLPISTGHSFLLERAFVYRDYYYISHHKLSQQSTNPHSLFIVAGVVVLDFGCICAPITHSKLFL